MVALEGFLWLSAGHFGGGERIGEEEREEARLSFSPQMGIAGLEGNGYLCRKFLKQSFFMKSLSLFALAALPAALTASVVDTSRVYNIEEAVIVASPKETSFLKRQPLSASLLGQQDLQALGATDIQGLSIAVPNVFLPSYGSRVTSSAYVRGVGSRIGAPAVGLYVDNVPFTHRSAYDFSFMDVERVDVLRGPQSTLYGGGTMGGLIRVFTADPFQHTGTEVHLGGSTGKGGREAKAVTYIHPSNRVALSLSGVYTGNNGFYRNASMGQSADAEDAAGAKVRLGYRPTDRLRLDLTSSYEYSDEKACPYFFVGTTTTPTPGRPLVGLDEIGQNRQSRYRRSLLNTSLGLTWNTRPFTLTSITAVQHLRDRLFMDQDFLSSDIFSLEQRQRMNTLTEEISLKGSNRARWQWVSGAYFRLQREYTSCPVTFLSDGMTFLNRQFASVLPQQPPMTLAFTDQSLNFTSSMHTPSTGAALYHQSTVRLGAGISATLGLRVEYDHRSLDLNSGLSPLANYTFAMPSFGINTTLTTDAAVNGRLKMDTWQVLPKFALNYDHRSGRGNVYVAVSKGYRPGGYNLQSYSELAQQALQRNMMLGVKDFSLATIDRLPLPDAVKERAKRGLETAISANLPGEPVIGELAYKAEEAWNYELGGHLRFLGGALMVDYTAYCIETKNRQLARFAESGLGRVTVNAGRSRSIGAEISLHAALLDNRLRLTGSYGYTHAELTRHNLGVKEGQTVDYSGNRVPFAPEHTMYADALYRQPLKHSFWRAVYVGVSTLGAGKIYWDEANSFSQPFYALLNARAGLELSKYANLEVRGQNLTGTRYATFSFNSMSNRFEQRGAPRYFEFALRLKF